MSALFGDKMSHKNGLLQGAEVQVDAKIWEGKKRSY